MGAILTPLLIASTGLSVYGSAQNAMASEVGGQTNAINAEWNAAMAEYEGDYLKKKSDVEARMAQKEVNRMVGQGRAAAGATGFDIGSGSIQDAIDDIVKSGSMDVALIRQRGDIGKWQKQKEATAYRLGGEQAIQAGNAGRDIYGMQAVSTVLNTAGNLYGRRKIKSRGAYPTTLLEA